MNINCPGCDSEIGELTENSGCKYCGYQFSEITAERIRHYNYLLSRLSGLEELSLKLDKEISELKTETQEYARLIKPETTAEITKEPEVKQNQPLTEKTSAVTRLNWEMLFGFNGFLILGVISVITGVGFFIRQAFISGFFGPGGKTALIYLGAFLSLATGLFFRNRKMRDFGLTLAGMGIALCYYATYAAYQKYFLFGELPALIIMSLITVFSVVMAVVDNNRWLAVAGLIGGFSTPVILSTGSDEAFTVLIYITILNAGLLSIAAYKRWNLLNNLGFVSTYLVFFLVFEPERFWPSVIFLNIFFFFYSLVPFAYHILSPENEKVENSWLIFFNSFIAIALNYYLFTKNNLEIEKLSVITLLYTLNFTFMAAYLYLKGKKQDQGYTFVIGKAAMFLVLTVPVLFSENIITILWLTEAVTLLWISRKLNSTGMIYGSYFLMVTAVMKFFLYDYPFIFDMQENFFFIPSYSYLILSRLTTALFLVISFYSYVRLLHSLPETFGPFHRKAGVIFTLGWVLSLLLLLNLEIAAFFYSYFSEARFVAISILWTVFAIILMYFGLRHDNQGFRKFAVSLFIMTVGKVFLFDIAELGASYKFISFLVLGLVLILASYLYRRFREEVRQDSN